MSPTQQPRKKGKIVFQSLVHPKQNLRIPLICPFTGAPWTMKGLCLEVLEKIGVADRFFTSSTSGLLDMVSQGETDLGQSLRQHRLGPGSRGVLADDNLVIPAVLQALSSPAARLYPNAVLDGFPRTIAQSEFLAYLHSVAKLGKVIFLDRTVEECWWNFHHRLEKMTRAGQQRQDDNAPGVFERRWGDFQKITLPAIEYLESRLPPGSVVRVRSSRYDMVNEVLDLLPLDDFDRDGFKESLSDLKRQRDPQFEPLSDFEAPPLPPGLATTQSPVLERQLVA